MVIEGAKGYSYAVFDERRKGRIINIKTRRLRIVHLFFFSLKKKRKREFVENFISPRYRRHIRRAWLPFFLFLEDRCFDKP